MRRFLLDTNICLAFVRGHEVYQQIESDLSLNKDDTITIISVVTKAELLSLGKRRGWENQKLTKLNRLLEKLFIIDISLVIQIKSLLKPIIQLMHLVKGI
ncbi:hypothetical protein QQ008_18160 [Fulvivirgaceae bacterium BMA10]|uniref:PIN domain-containing protein n=1 Tax=Splendidivirga corallicola TaxID=3051826 RepID=A0ABT8KRD1_9BACT|nr:hypothetical protein [Fulvivirgaceae bacterium BMA10]